MTPDENVTLTEALAQYHAAAFDAQGKLYFTEEAFDDFTPVKVQPIQTYTVVLVFCLNKPVHADIYSRR